MAQLSSISVVVDSPSLRNPKCISKHGVLDCFSFNEQGEADYALWHHMPYTAKVVMCLLSLVIPMYGSTG